MPHSVRSIGLPILSSFALVLEARLAHRVAERVAADHLELRIVAPLVGVADLGREHRQLGARLDLGLGVHPGQVGEAVVHRRDDVLDQLVRLGLGGGREILGDVKLARRLAERVRGRIDATLPPRLVLRRARQRGAVEGEVQVDELLGQNRRPAVERVEGEVRLPGVERLVVDQLRRALDRAGVGDDQRRLARDAGGGEQRLPLDARIGAADRGNGDGVVQFLDLALLDAGPVRGRDLDLQVVDRLGLGGGVGHLRGGQQVDDILLVIGADIGELGVLGVEVIVAVGHAEAALAGIDRVDIGVLQVLRRADADRHVDAAAARLAERRRQLGAVGDRGDLVQRGLERGQALALDAGLVDEAGVIVADLLGLAAGRVVGGCRRRLDDGAGALLAEVAELGEHRVVRLVSRDHQVLDVGAVGVAAPVVAGGNALVHAGGVEAESAVLRPRGGGRLMVRRRGIAGRGQRERSRGREQNETTHGYSPEVFLR